MRCGGITVQYIAGTRSPGAVTGLSPSSQNIGFLLAAPFPPEVPVLELVALKNNQEDSSDGGTAASPEVALTAGADVAALAVTAAMLVVFLRRDVNRRLLIA